MKFIFSIIFLQLLFCSGVGFSQENIDLSKVNVSKVEFIDDKGQYINDPVIEHMVDTKAGSPLNPDFFVTDIDSLVKSFPNYSEVLISIGPKDSNNSVVVTYEFQVKRKIQMVRFELTNVEENVELRDQLRTQKGMVLRGIDIDEDKKTIANLYIEAGYPDVQVTHEINEDKDTNVIVNFKLLSSNGKRFSSKAIFRGNKFISSNKLSKVIKNRKKAFKKAKPLNVQSIDDEIKAIKELYEAQGFLEAQVEYKLEHSSKNKTNIVFSIIENKRHKVKKISMTGMKFFDLKKLKTVLGIKVEDFFSSKYLRMGMQKLREIYGENGFSLIQINSDFISSEGELVVEIIEGQQQYVDSVVISGNNFMKEEVILHDVTFVPGELVNLTKVNETLTKMRRTGYFEEVSVEFDPVSDTTGKIIINVKEARGHVIEFAAGSENGGDLGGRIGYQDPNFFGTGNSLDISIARYAEMNRLSLIFRNPHLFGSDYALTASSHLYQMERHEFDTQKLDTRVMITKMITKNISLGVGTRIQFMDIKNVSEELENEIHDASGKSRIIGMVSTIAYRAYEENENGDVIKENHIRLSLMPSYSENGLYNKAIVNALKTVDLHKTKKGDNHTLSGRVTLGYASENTPFHEKFYAGGMSTVRGYVPRSVTPTGSVAGGKYLASANLTYSFPIINKLIKGVVFVETANVSNNIKDFSNIKVVGGIGIKANLKNTFLQNNLEAGIVLPMSRKENDKLRLFYFMMGNYDPAYDL